MFDGALRVDPTFGWQVGVGAIWTGLFHRFRWHAGAQTHRARADCRRITAERRDPRPETQGRGEKRRAIGRFSPPPLGLSVSGRYIFSFLHIGLSFWRNDESGGY